LRLAALPDCGAVKILRPGLHQGPPPFDSGATPICALLLVAYRVSQSLLDQLARKLGGIAGPISEGLRMPWVVTLYPIRRSNIAIAMFERAAPPTAKTRSAASGLFGLSASRSVRVGGDSGTTCSAPAFMRCVGIVQSLRSGSISPHVAPRFPPNAQRSGW
jgi:hypothetical protein